MLRQCPRWPWRIRRRNMPIRLFVLPSFHPEAVQSDLSQLEVKRWTAGKEALNHSSSLEHRQSPVRPCKSLNSFSPRERGTKKWKQRSSWLHLVKIWPKSFQIANLLNMTKRERSSLLCGLCNGASLFILRRSLQWKWRILTTQYWEQRTKEM